MINYLAYQSLNYYWCRQSLARRWSKDISSYWVGSPLNNTCVTSHQHWAYESLCNKSNIPHIRSGLEELISPLTAETLTLLLFVLLFFQGLYHSEEGSSNAEDPEDVYVYQGLLLWNDTTFVLINAHIKSIITAVLYYYYKLNIGSPSQCAVSLIFRVR